MKKNKNILNLNYTNFTFGLLILFTLIVLYFIFTSHTIFWDSGVYIGMAKYYFTFGAIGIQEVFRPPLFPFILGTFWKLGFDASFIGNLISLLSGIGSIYYTYKISKIFLDKKKSFLVALALFCSASFIYYTTVILNDILGVFLVIFTIYLTLKDKNKFTIGVLCGLSSLNRFSLLLLPISIGIYYIFCFLKSKQYSKDDFKQFIIQLILFCGGFLIILIPFFIYSKIEFGFFLAPLLEGNEIIQIVGKSINEGFLFYPKELFLESIIVVLTIFGIIFSKKKKEDFLIILFLGLFFIYHLFLARKEIRYMLPLLWIFYLYGIRFFNSLKLNMSLKKIIVTLLIIAIITQLISGLYFYKNNINENWNKELKENYYTANVTGPIVTTTPNIMQFIDEKVILITWTSENIYESHKQYNPKAFIINTCDLWCDYGDEECYSYKDKFINEVSEEFTLVYSTKVKWCDYYVFKMD